jgi:hypothetical protein
MVWEVSGYLLATVETVLLRVGVAMEMLLQSNGLLQNSTDSYIIYHCHKPIDNINPFDS